MFSAKHVSAGNKFNKLTGETLDARVPSQQTKRGNGWGGEERRVGGGGGGRGWGKGVGGGWGEGGGRV